MSLQIVLIYIQMIFSSVRKNISFDIKRLHIFLHKVDEKKIRAVLCVGATAFYSDFGLAEKMINNEHD